MQNARLKALQPTAIYDLPALFGAVNGDLDDRKAVLAQYSEDWQKGFAGAAMAKSLEDISETLKHWMNAGATHAQFDAPYSDGSISEPVENMMSSQFREGRVKPLKNGTVLEI